MVTRAGHRSHRRGQKSLRDYERLKPVFEQTRIRAEVMNRRTFGRAPEDDELKTASKLMLRRLRRNTLRTLRLLFKLFVLVPAMPGWEIINDIEITAPFI